MTSIIVKETEEAGEFVVIRGGDVYRKLNGQAVPGSVKAGDKVSAAEICEWVEFGIDVTSAWDFE